jgi:hypothetical protein
MMGDLQNMQSQTLSNALLRSSATVRNLLRGACRGAEEAEARRKESSLFTFALRCSPAHWLSDRRSNKICKAKGNTLSNALCDFTCTLASI